MLTLFTALAADASGLQGPEPVLEEAQADLRSVRLARTAQLVSLAAPALVVTGLVVFESADPFQKQLEQQQGVNTQALAGGALAVAGLLTGTAALTLSHVYTQKGRRHLLRQGLSVKRVNGTLVPLTVSVFAVGGGLLVLNAVAGGGVGPVNTLFVGAVFGSALGLVTLQLNHNRRARRQAGWLALSPGPRGMSLSGTW